MRPRTKREKLVVELSSKLPAITEAQLRWGKKHCFAHNAYKCKDEMWCNDCGKMWVDITGQNYGSIRCPYCGEKLEVHVSRKAKDQNYDYEYLKTYPSKLGLDTDFDWAFEHVFRKEEQK